MRSPGEPTLAETAHATRSGPGRWLAVVAAFAALLLSGTALVFATTSRTAQPTGGGPAPPTGPCDATAVAARTMPSVVTLFVTSATGAASNGSGEFLDTDGHVLTNNHVISAAVGGGTIVVMRPNGEELPATLVGRDIATDLAVVKVKPKEPAQPVTFAGPVPPIGTSVFAVGAPRGLTETFTAGVVSGLGRSVRVPADNGATALLVAAIQTDTAINPGNSGGLLANCAGELVGVPTAGTTASDSLGQPVAGNIGLGFAIPAATAHRVASGLIKDGKVTHGDFGLSVAPILGPSSTINPSGLYVTTVTVGGPAAGAGLRRSDVITDLAGQPITGADQLEEISLSKPPGTSVELTVRRGAEVLAVNLVLG